MESRNWIPAGISWKTWNWNPEPERLIRNLIFGRQLCAFWMVTYGNRTTTDSDAYTSHIYIVDDDYLVSSLQCKCK